MIGTWPTTIPLRFHKNYKQVCNLHKAIASRPSCNPNIKNAADDMQTMINVVQEHNFMQSVVLRKVRSLIVISYLPQQIQICRGFVAKIPRHICIPSSALTAHLTLDRATLPLWCIKTWLSFVRSQAIIQCF